MPSDQVAAVMNAIRPLQRALRRRVQSRISGSAKQARDFFFTAGVSFSKRSRPPSCGLAAPMQMMRCSSQKQSRLRPRTSSYTQTPPCGLINMRRKTRNLGQRIRIISSNVTINGFSAHRVAGRQFVRRNGTFWTRVVHQNEFTQDMLDCRLPILHIESSAVLRT